MKNFTPRAIVLFVMTLCMAVFNHSAWAQLPSPTTNYKNLNVIETVPVELQMEIGGESVAWVEADINSLLQASGLSLADAQANVNDIFYLWKYDDSETAEDYFVADELQPLSKEGSWWWLDFADEKKDVFVAKGYSENCFAWSTNGNVLNDEGIFTIGFGTYNGAAIGQKAHSQMYAIIGEDAILWDINVEVVAEKVPTFEECTLVGEVTVVTDNQLSNGWNGRAVRWDLDAALTALGASSPSELRCFYLNEDGEMTNDYQTYDGLGYWMSMDGVQQPFTSGTKSWFAQVKSEDGRINVGHMPGDVFTGDGTEVCKGSFYLRYGTNIYKLNFEMTVIPDKEAPTDFVEKGYGELYLQGLANYNDWSVGYNVQLDYEKALEVTEAGPSDVLTLYAKTPEGEWNKTTTTTVASGFWMTADGKWCQYGNGNAYFFENVNFGVIGNWGHVPGEDVPGTTYTGEIYYVNEANGYYYTIRYRIDFVEEIGENNVVGEENITVVVSDDGALTEVDITPALTALGIEETEIPDEATWSVPVFATIYGEDNYTGEGYAFDAEGKTCNIDTEEGAGNAIYRIGYDAQDGGFYAEAWQDIPADAQYSIKIALGYGGKYYVYNITVVPAGEVDGITTTRSIQSAFDGKAYNLSGQSVDGSYRGFVIKNGKKYIQK